MTTTTILFNGPIYTLDPDQPRAQALAIREGRILAVGSEGKVQAAAISGKGKTEGLNLRGRAVIPGLTDAHLHLLWFGLAARQVQLGATPNFEAALKMIADRAATLPPNAWLLGGGWDQDLWGRAWPTANDLDRVCPNHPAFLVRKDGHSAWVNRPALALAGIDDQTPDPSNGRIGRDQKGKPNGILVEGAQELIWRILEPPSPLERLQIIQAALTTALSYGLTSLHIAPGVYLRDSHDTLADLQILRGRGDLHQRCLLHLALPDLAAALALGLRSGFGDRWLRLGNLKLFADGSLGSETAELLQPYENRQHKGLSIISGEELSETTHRAIHAGLSVAIHAIGDAANRKALDAIERALKPRGPIAAVPAPLALPNRIEHAMLIDPQDLPRFGALGLIASMQPAQVASSLALAERFLGSRCAQAFAWHDLQEAGVPLAFGSAAPSETINPWLGIHAAVTRQRPNGTPEGGWYPEQRLSLISTLKGYCVGPALASSEENLKGKLKPGMLADLVVLAADPFQVRPAELPAIETDMTIVEGQIVWERAGS